MPQKHVIVTFHHSPIGGNGCVEGLRASVGVTSGTEENTVGCIFFDDAVHFALRDADRREAQKHVDALAGMNAPLLVDAASLQARSLPSDAVVEPFRVVERAEIVAALRSAEATLAF